MKTLLPSLAVSVTLALALGGCGAANSGFALPAGNAMLLRPASTAAVDLRSAGAFAVLAGSTVTSSGRTHIAGDVGIASGTAITGFPPGSIRGTLYDGGRIAVKAEHDLATAFDGAMGRSGSFVTVSGNIGGQTLKPGLYKSTSSLAVSSGDLTLDGGGKADSVWVFVMGSTFTMTTGHKVVLTNGARASHVFWAVGSSATLGQGCVVRGDLLVRESISLGTGAVVDGRALARAGAVTLENNQIVRPLK